MRPVPALATLLLLGSSLTACAHGGAGRAPANDVLRYDAANPASPEATAALTAALTGECAFLARSGAGRRSDVLVAPQRFVHDNSTMLTIVERHRPLWFRSRSPSLSGGMGQVVYLDGQRFGGFQSLSLIPVSNVTIARYLSASEAQHYYGMNHPDGAIDIHTHC